MPYSPEEKPFPVVVHPFPSPTQHSCAYELVAGSGLGSGPSPSPSPGPRNALVFIGGLGDGPHTVPYIRAIAGRLEADGDALGYSVFELRMSSAFAGYGYTRLADDVRDLSALVRYLRGTLGREKVVFLGHSTGCQDCMEYTDYAKYGAEPVDGFILQGPVSDREAFSRLLSREQLDDSLAAAAELIRAGAEDAVMPRGKLPGFFVTPVTAYRWHSLIAPGGDDDYFSSDLPDAKLASFWGRIQKPVLILPSGADEHVPETVDVAGNVERWKRLCAPGIASELSGLIPGASHNVEEPEAQQWMAERVVRFLESLE